MMGGDGSLWGGTAARYRPFGGYAGSTPANYIQNRGFTGHDRTQADDALGVVYMNARVYMPSTGKFLTPDTLVPDPANSQSYNRYAYVHNNPINLTDPSGHCAMTSTGGRPIRDPNDQVCWDQYDNLSQQLEDDGYSDNEIESLLGSGQNWKYRDDAHLFGTLRGYGMSWETILGNQWGTTSAPSRNTASCIFMGGACYELLYYGDQVICMLNSDGEFELVYKLSQWVNGRWMYKFALKSDAAAFITNVNTVNRHMQIIAAELGVGAYIVGACLGTGAITAVPTAGISLAVATTCLGIPAALGVHGLEQMIDDVIGGIMGSYDIWDLETPSIQ